MYQKSISVETNLGISTILPINIASHISRHKKYSYFVYIFSFLILGLTSMLTQAQTSESWVEKGNFAGLARRGAASFTIGNKGYTGTGFVTYRLKDFWEYDATSDTWSQKADFGGSTRYYAVGFAIENKGYIATGDDGNAAHGGATSDIWEYDPSSNSWTQKSQFPGVPRFGSVGFSIGTKGYIGTGHLDPALGDPAFRVNDFWEFDPNSGTDGTWTEKHKIGGDAAPSTLRRAYAASFSINGKGYIGTGNTEIGKRKDFWEYDPIADTWTQKADFGGSPRFVSLGLAIGSKGYIGTGDIGGTAKFTNDFWEYDPTTDKWAQKLNLPDSIDTSPTGFSIGGKGYIGTGDYGLNRKPCKVFFEYTPAGILSASDDDLPASNSDAFGAYLSNNDIIISNFKNTSAKITVTDLLGKVIIRSRTDGNSQMALHIQKLHSGVYIVNMLTDHKVESKKIFIN